MTATPVTRWVTNDHLPSRPLYSVPNSDRFLATSVLTQRTAWVWCDWGRHVLRAGGVYSTSATVTQAPGNRRATMTPSRVGTMVDRYRSSSAIIALCRRMASVHSGRGSASAAPSTTRPDHRTLSQR